MDKPFVFHLKREFFDMIQSGSKTCEYRFKVPEGLSRGSRIRFDLGYKPLSDKSSHLYAFCDGVERVSLRSCPEYVFKCFGIDSGLLVSASSLIYKISFILVGRVDDSKVISAPIVGSFGG